MENTKKFSSRIYLFTLSVNILAAALVFAYSSFFIMLRPMQLIYAFLISFVTLVIYQFSISYILNKISTKSIDELFEKRSTGNLNSIESKTLLYKKLLQFPVIKTVENTIYFIILTGTLCLLYHFVPQIALDTTTSVISYAACLYGAYITGVTTLSYTERACSDYAKEIAEEGIDESLYGYKNKSGKITSKTPFFLRTILFLIIPFFFINIMDILILVQGYTVTNGIIIGSVTQIKRIVFSNIFFFILTCMLTTVYYMYLTRSTQKTRDCVSQLLKYGKSKTDLSTALTDKIQYNMFLLGRVISFYSKLIAQAEEIGKSVLRSTEDLAVISTEVESTAIEQSSDVKEILSTMEDANALSQNISSRISEVSKGTDSTKDEVSEAFYLIKESTKQMTEINSSNTQVLDGIKKLTEQIDGIDDIVKIIKDIADQTKIIAFNAELEAVSAGKAGRNFHIVASEIRRLANNTMTSIDEIKDTIDDIQQAGKKLIETSNKNTDFIDEENNTVVELENQFSAIMSSSNETSEKTAEITDIISQQTASFNQIVITLRQISAGIESFSYSTKSISDTVNEMKTIATKLSDLNSLLTNPLSSEKLI